MKVQYLEIVTSDVDGVIAAYASALDVQFSDPDAGLPDIDAALEAAVQAGGQIAHPPLEIPGHGTFTIYHQGGDDHGLWQR